MGDATEYRDEDVVPFVVDDETATAYVDPEGAEVRMSGQEEVTVEEGERPPEHIAAFIEEETDLDVVRNKKRWFREYRIAAGDEVYVAGTADLDGVTDGDHGATVAVDGDGAPRFFVSDDPDHGLDAQLLREVLVSFLAAALLFGVAAWLVLG